MVNIKLGIIYKSERFLTFFSMSTHLAIVRIQMVHSDDSLIQRLLFEIGIKKGRAVFEPCLCILKGKSGSLFKASP